MQKIVYSIVFLVFLFPILFFSTQVGIHLHFASDLDWVVKNSFIQSFGTSLLCVFFSFIFLNQTLALSEKKFRILEKFLLGPVYVPSVFILMVWLGLFNFFPMGNLSVILVQSLIYCGFTTVYLSNLVKNKLGVVGFISEVYGVSYFTFLFKILIPFLKKEIIQLVTILSIFSFTSFAVPFMVGGGRGTNFEVFIYEKIYLDQKWSELSSLVLVQFFILMGLSYLSRKQSKYYRKFLFSKYFDRSFVSYSIYLYLGMIYGGLIFLSLRLLTDLDLSPLFLNQLITGFYNSITLFAITFVFLVALTMVFIWLYYCDENLSVFKVFMSPSIMLTGFSFYLLSENGGWFQFVKASLVLVYTYFFGMFFFYFENKLHQLNHQKLISRIYGVSFWNFFRTVFLSQNKKEIVLVCSLIFLTCLSDFVFLQSVGGGIDTLGTLLEAYLSSYRVQYAIFVGIVCLCATGLFYLILEKIYVEN